MVQFYPRSAKTRVALLSLITSVLLVGCGGGKNNVAEISAPPAQAVLPTTTAPTSQSKLCAFSDDDGAARCESGQIAIYLPERWGNEQLPIIWAAKYCNFNFTITHTKGAMSCVFYKGRSVIKSEEKAPQVSPQSPASNPQAAQ